jgi:hypothetical protein
VIYKNAFTRYAQFFLLGALYLAPAYGAEIIELRVTSGEFAMGPFTSGGPVPYSFADGSYNLIADFPTTIGWDDTQRQTSEGAGSVVAFAFGTPFVNTFSVPCDPQNVDDCVNFPHTAFSGTVNGASATISDGDPIIVDTNGFYANWNGIDFNQGGVTEASGFAYPGQSFGFPFTSTVSNVQGNTFNYDMTWQSRIIGGPFNGQTGTWRFIGTGVVAQATNDPKTDPGLVLAPNNFATILITTSDLQNAGYPLPGSDNDCVSGCWDWIVTGLANEGDTVNVVLPLVAPIPDATQTGFQIQKFDTPINQWELFDTTGPNRVSSAGLVGGVCPDPGDAAYQSPPVTGHICLQLSVQDGGPNDGDGLPNQIVIDPGATVAGAGGGDGDKVTKISDNGCSLSTADVDPLHRADWWLLAGFVLWLGLRHRAESNR